MRISRRHWIKGIAAGTFALASSFAAKAGQLIAFSGYRPGTIVVVTHRRELFFVLRGGRAIRYPVGVGRAGMAWHGFARVARKDLHPAWSPPEDTWRHNPSLPDVIPGGRADNPMGAAALGLNRGNYGIHGTNNPASVGCFVSHGCIRMYNRDILDLYRHMPVGTPVVVLR